MADGKGQQRRSENTTRSATSATGRAAYPVDFTAFVQAEVNQINARRKRLADKSGGRLTSVAVTATGPGADVLEVVGLTMSGGGIRSASFCLGVAQAFDGEKVFDHVDYLSTVSGGGYLGAAISTTMAATGGDFVFGEGNKTAPKKSYSDLKDTAAVAHIRDYSNYLIPRGLPSLFTALAIILRGLVANAALVLPVVLCLAAVTVFANPTRSSLLRPDIIGVRLWFLPATHFGVTLLLLGVTFIGFLWWAMRRSRPGSGSEFCTPAPSRAAWWLAVPAAMALFEAQPFVIDGMFDLYETAAIDGRSTSLIAGIVQWATALAAPFLAATTLFRQQIATLLKSVTASSSVSKKAAGFAGQAALWLGGLAVPLLIWVGYLFLCYWAIANDGKKPEATSRPAIQGTVEITGPGLRLSGRLDCHAPDQIATCAATKPPAAPDQAYAHTPHWLQACADATRALARTVAQGVAEIMPDEATNGLRAIGGGLGNLGKVLTTPEVSSPEAQMREREYIKRARSFVLFYLLAMAAFLWTWRSLTPNANSLHRLYRDRLSKAFLFNPVQDDRGPEEPADKTRDLPPLDGQLISTISGKHGPYHLINAALNIQGSRFANRRGRNADFFLFSPLKTGSVATSYVDTRDLEDRGLDLATAMAISGAAFSSNMGSSSIRALTLTLALLNVRTGYWLDNPKYISDPRGKPDGWYDRRNLYFLNELTSRLDEDSAEIYVTDGGHIENLGMYELLRRRCRTIVVIDAEADPAMRFASFVTLQRYARIDLGIRILLPWDKIAATTLLEMGANVSDAQKADAKRAADDVQAATEAAKKPMGGLHVAIGRILYDNDLQGQLLYIKSSLSGDENDYVRDYARRFGDFPHETTGDQMFSEEQFEAYRALGFHAARRMLIGQDLVQVEGEAALHNFVADSPSPLVKSVWNALHGQSDAGNTATPMAAV